MKISIISFTLNGDLINKKVCECFPEYNIVSNGKGFNLKDCTLNEWTSKAFKDSDAVIFIGAMGIAVRAIAPYITKKDTDPAVVVIDEHGKYVIPVLSGHIGGANRFAKTVAEHLKSIPIITTATDLNGVWAVDVWAAENGYSIYNIDAIKYISGALLRGEKVGIKSDYDIVGKLPCNIVVSDNECCGICISNTIKKPYKNTLSVVPKNIVIGVGSKANADEKALIELYETIKAEYGFLDKSVCAVATIDIKKNEKSVLALVNHIGTELKLYTADELNSAVGDFVKSEFVKSVTGTDNVCERAAVLCGGRIKVRKTKGNGVTIAVSEKEWRVVF